MIVSKTGENGVKAHLYVAIKLFLQVVEKFFNKNCIFHVGFFAFGHLLCEPLVILTFGKGWAIWAKMCIAIRKKIKSLH